MDAPICQNCTHFFQHYVLDEQSCTAVNCGHCKYPRLKNRAPHTPACEHFALREAPAPYPDRDAVIHFLTTEVLQYILSLELPPDVAP